VSASTCCPTRCASWTSSAFRAPLEAAGTACGELAYYTKRGQRIWAERAACAPAIAGRRSRSTRGSLQMLLLEAASARIGADRIRARACIWSRFEAQPGWEYARRFLGPSARGVTRSVDARLLIPGRIHSATRRSF